MTEQETEEKIVFLEPTFSLLLIFLSALVIGAILYVIGSLVAPKSEKAADKLAPYACGEDMPPRKFQVDLRRFFLYVTYFMIFDISAFMLALSFTARGVYPVLFSVVIALSLFTIIPMIRRGKK